MQIQNPEAKQKLNQRLRRIEGQLRGVQAMVDDERECGEILQQLSAIRSAVQSASRIFLQEYASACLVSMEQGDDPETAPARRQKMVQDMLNLLDKAP
jgi:DNA-binding FrmR family transcriptional regulator